MLSPTPAAFAIKGFLIGLAIAAPVGPIGVLCIRRTLTAGRLSGLVSGLGAATADAVYGAIAAFGLTAASRFLVAHQAALRAVGGLFLLYLGAKALRARTPGAGGAVEVRHRAGDYLSTFALTLANPMTIVSFAAVFAGLGAGTASGRYLDSLALVAGVFAGSAAWWLILASAVDLTRRRASERLLRSANLAAGFLICLFGLLALAAAANLSRGPG